MEGGRVLSLTSSKQVFMGTQICKNEDTVVICCPKFAWALNDVGVTVYTKHHCSKYHFPNEKKRDHGFQAQTQYWEHCSLQVNLLRYKRLISKSSDPEALTKELRVCIITILGPKKYFIVHCIHLGDKILISVTDQVLIIMVIIHFILLKQIYTK